ncbi:MAG: amino acid permease [Polyangiaceae bacterium]|jgi:APA family basic amino acid/polyamine antiporter
MPKGFVRDLRMLDAALLVVGSIVGGGIFLVSHDVAQDVGSEGAFLAAWIIGGAVALAGALSNGELGGLYPHSGGEYVYLREAYGSGPAFLSGWTSFWIGFPGSIAALAAGLGATVSEMLGLNSVAAAKAIGVVSIACLTVVNALGVRPGKWVNNVLSVTKMAAFATLLLLGLLFTSRGAVAAPAPAPTTGESSVSGIAAALIPVLFAYSGWNAATYVAGEMREPTKGLGRALALGTGSCVILYLAVNATYLRAMSLAELAATHDSPARLTAERLGGPVFAGLLAPLIAICVLSSLQATILVGPRIYHAMATDRLFFRSFGKIEPRTGTPFVALIAQAGIACAEFLTGSFGQLLAFAMFSIVTFSTLAVAAVLLLRIRCPAAHRPFRVPGGPLLPALFVAVNAWVLWSELAGPYFVDALVGIAIVATGIPAYLVFRARECAYAEEKAG